MSTRESLGAYPGDFLIFKPGAPSSSSVLAQGQTEAMLTPYFLATAACLVPALRSLAAAKRRRSICSIYSWVKPILLSASQDMGPDICLGA